MRYLNVLFVILLTVLCVGTVSCAKKEKPPEEPPYPVRTEVIDGVKVLISPNYPQDGREVYEFEEELNIGVEEGDEYYQLYRPQDIKVAENGEIYVIDWREAHLRVYDDDGQYLRTITKKGRGPGEFETPASFDFLSDGSLVILDGRNRQVSILDKNGTYVSGFKVEGYCANLIVDGQDQLYFEKTLSKEVDVIGVNQIIEDKMNIYCTDLDGRKFHDYGIFGGKKMSFTRTKQGSIASSSPFSRYLIFDDESNLWLWHHTRKEEENGCEYDVFSPGGIYIRQVVVPHRIHRIKNGRAYSIIRNEEGFSFIKRFRFVQ